MQTVALGFSVSCWFFTSHKRRRKLSSPKCLSGQHSTDPLGSRSTNRNTVFQVVASSKPSWYSSTCVFSTSLIFWKTKLWSNHSSTCIPIGSMGLVHLPTSTIRINHSWIGEYTVNVPWMSWDCSGSPVLPVLSNHVLWAPSLKPRKNQRRLQNPKSWVGGCFRWLFRSSFWVPWKKVNQPDKRSRFFFAQEIFSNLEMNTLRQTFGPLLKAQSSFYLDLLVNDASKISSQMVVQKSIYHGTK